MPRSRKQWSTLRGEIRDLLRETVADDSFWDDPELLQYWNQAMDLRAMQLGDQHEGYLTEPFDTDLKANQEAYQLPEGSGRVKRVLAVFDEGNGRYEVPLTRSERWSEPTRHAASSTTGGVNDVPTYRLMGDFIILEPRPVVGRTNGLRIELESMPIQFSTDTSKIPLAWPIATETLLTYDTWDIAVGVENAVDMINQAVRDRLDGVHRRLESAWLDYTAIRTFGRTFSAPYYLGD